MQDIIGGRFSTTTLVALLTGVSSGCSCTVTTTGPGGETSDDDRPRLEDAATTPVQSSSSAGTAATTDTPTPGLTVDLEATAEMEGGIDASSDDAGGNSVGDADVPDAESTSALDPDATPADCSSVYQQCDNGMLHVCEEVGATEVLFQCADGCDADAGTCRQLQLDDGWFVHQFELADDAIQTEAAYTFESGGLVATQVNNPMASVYVKDVDFESIRVAGRVSVTTLSDDDMFGVVFGWQDPEHFYLLDWKQAEQEDGACGLAPAGVTLKRIDATEPLTACADLWAGAGTGKVVPLSEATGEGWVENTVYDFELVFRPGTIRVTLTQGDVVVANIESDDTTYSHGRFGFYNYSQEGVRYEFFTVEPAL